ncbi:Gfo/Idh/MocA family protein [Thermococcus sibiricus]|uniref:NADH-dependent dyhydrogenase related protein n=2 Tax=Thermococcus sibiricus TaxID=172049 RepID=C6A539_THESM|nr:Gfo/Idh/MocA family oxidoreductase [Thermococcus sibiricus]ACS90734.1 NADH-dependent dyhydrogenase related protein [Thermococcus sibiricus MM 739]KUK17507.1 MAG: NADH-dependent dehydrogenase related protein [Thermococcus sibiricus]
MINVGIISYAHPHALRYGKTFASNPKAKLYAISGDGANTDVAIAEAQKMKAKFYSNYESLLKDEKVDAVYIAIETYRHKEIAIRAAEEGKHILLEKPIALTLEDADEIIRAVKKAGVKLMVPFNLRFTVPLKKAKAMIDSGEIGNLEYIYAISEYVKPPIFLEGLDMSWFLDKNKSGGGGFMDTAPHGIDSLLWLINDEPKSIYANIGPKIFGFPVDDIGTAVLEFKNGVVAVLNAGWANPKGYSYGLEIKYYLLGKEGFLDIRTAYPDFTVYQDKAEKIYWERADVSGIVNSFLNSIIEDKDPPITGEMAKKNLKIILAAYESSKTGKIIKL